MHDSNTYAGVIFLAAFVVIVACIGVFNSLWFRRWKENRQVKRARWHTVSGVENGGTYRLRICLIRPDGHYIRDVAKWSCDVNDPAFEFDRGLKIGEARAQCDDLNAELEAK